MFGFLCKNLRGFDVRTCPLVLVLQFSRNPSVSALSSLRYISSSENSANERSFTVSYLINSCGLSSESALSASKHVHFKNVHKPDSVLSLLKSLDFSETDISKLVKKYPRILSCNPETTLLPKLDFLLSRGFSSSDIAKLLMTIPDLVHRSLENHIIPTYNFLNNLLQTDQKTVAAIKRSHILLSNGMGKGVARKINLLRDKGVSQSNIVAILHYHPTILSWSFDKVKTAVKEAMDMGFNPSRRVFVNAVVSLGGMSKSTWDKKIDVYKRWNLSEEKILGAFRKQPDFVAKSEDKIMAVMDLFVNKLGWESSSVAKCPFLMGCSLEKRLIPRASVLQFLASRGLVKNCRNTTIFWCSETTFLEKYVNRYDEASELIKLYNQKLALSNSLGKQQE